MTSILKTDEIQSQNGGAVVKMQTLKHPSASGNNLELASDGNVSITNTLSAGTIGSNVSFPTGHVIQTQSNTAVASSHEQVGNSSTYTSSLLADTITTKVDNSKILIMYSTFGSHTQTATRGTVWLQRTIGGVATQIQQNKLVHNWGNYTGNTGSNYYPIHIYYMDTPNVSAETEINYASRFSRASGSNNFYYVHSGYVYQTILQEIMP